MLFVCAQGHRLWTIHAGGMYPCPQLNFSAFDSFYAAVYGLDPTPSANSIAKTFGAPFSPWLSDETFITSVFALEELGAKGNKVYLRDPPGTVSPFRPSLCATCMMSASSCAVAKEQDMRCILHVKYVHTTQGTTSYRLM